jgi:hypothetical protein
MRSTRASGAAICGKTGRGAAGHDRRHAFGVARRAGERNRAADRHSHQYDPVADVERIE